MNMQALFQAMIEMDASDIHLTAGSPPCFRIHGEVKKLEADVLLGADIRRMLFEILSEDQKEKLEDELQLDFSVNVQGLARFRGNIFFAKGELSAVFRIIPSHIPEFEELGLPQILLEMMEVTNGIILVTGPTGSGKSTTLASMLNFLNRNFNHHIVTIEDPIEFVHEDLSSIVNQREIGRDVFSFPQGLKAMLRQDPDVVLIGELRDLETVEAALTIAETGHLVFGTLHTNSAPQTINRIVNVFPQEQQDQVRTILSFVLQGVISQQLIPNTNGDGRELAMEILRFTPAIRNLVRDDKLHQVYSAMQTGQSDTGMRTMNQSLYKLVQERKITEESAIACSPNATEILKLLGKG